MVDINRSVKNYYEQAQLSEEQLDRLLAMQAVSEGASLNREADGVAKTKGPVLGVLSLAASILFAVTLVFVIGTENINERVAQEVALNHNKALAVEYEVDSYEVLSRHMDKLDFSLRAPGHTSLENFTLLGGRYCSIQGQIAAQIKLADSTGQVFTLYQTRADKQLSVLDKGRIQLDQVDIRLWEEQGLLFALAAAVK